MALARLKSAQNSSHVDPGTRGRVELDFLPADDSRRLIIYWIKQTAQRMHCLAQVLACLCIVVVGPKQPGDLFAALGLRFDGQVGQEGALLDITLLEKHFALEYDLKRA
jgi:hypothetical protein